MPPKSKGKGKGKEAAAAPPQLFVQAEIVEIFIEEMVKTGHANDPALIDVEGRGRDFH